MTATISESDTDLDMTVLDALDFEAALVCEWGKRSGRHCDQAAVWILRYKCCDETILICQTHRDVTMRLASGFVGKVKHDVCQKLVEIKSVDRI